MEDSINKFVLNEENENYKSVIKKNQTEINSLKVKMNKLMNTEEKLKKKIDSFYSGDNSRSKKLQSKLSIARKILFFPLIALAPLAILEVIPLLPFVIASLVYLSSIATTMAVKSTENDTLSRYDKINKNIVDLDYQYKKLNEENESLQHRIDKNLSIINKKISNVQKDKTNSQENQENETNSLTLN